MESWKTSPTLAVVAFKAAFVQSKSYRLRQHLDNRGNTANEASSVERICKLSQALILKWWSQQGRHLWTAILKNQFIPSVPSLFTVLLFIAWPWAPEWHDDMLSTLMVYDGIKALSGGHSRCSEPRPWVALHGWRAVISSPDCQRWPPPSRKTYPFAISAGADGVQGMHFSVIHCCVLGCPDSGNEGSCVRVFTATIKTLSVTEFLLK